MKFNTLLYLVYRARVVVSLFTYNFSIFVVGSLFSCLSAIGHFYIGLVSSKTGRCRGNFNCIDFCDFPTDLGFPLTAAEMGLDWELSVNYVQNIEITIELSQFQPLFLPNHGRYHGNSQLRTCHSHLKM